MEGVNEPEALGTITERPDGTWAVRDGSGGCIAFGDLKRATAYSVACILSTDVGQILREKSRCALDSQASIAYQDAAEVVSAVVRRRWRSLGDGTT